METEELQRRHDRLEEIFNEVVTTGQSFTLYNVNTGQPSVVITEYHQYQAMLEMLQELSGEEETTA